MDRNLNFYKICNKKSKIYKKELKYKNQSKRKNIKL